MRLILTLVFGLMALPASAQCVGENLIDTMSYKDRAALDAAIAAHPYPSGNLWRAQKGGSTIHIMGTMHLSDARLTPYLESLWPIVDAADLILLEGNRESMDKLKSEMMTNASLMFITDGPTLPERLPDEDWQHLMDEMSARGIPSFLVSKMQPWYVSMMLAVPPCAMAGIAEQNGVDHRIMDRAENRNIPTAALEPYDTALSLFVGDDSDDELDTIHIALAGAQNAEAMMATLIETYLSGEHRAIWELGRRQTAAMKGVSAKDSARMFGELESSMLTQRNANWMDVILPAANKTDTILVAVGAAHLSGENGVLYLLEQSGYSMTRVQGF